MAVGKPKTKYSPIVRAIQEAEKHTTGEIRVHLSQRRFEKDPYPYAEKLFRQYGMARTSQRNAILLYVNMRKHHFAIIGDEGIHRIVGQSYWQDLARHLSQDLQSTHLENAVALAVKTIGTTLQHHFPLEPGAENPNELDDEVLSD